MSLFRRDEFDCVICDTWRPRSVLAFVGYAGPMMPGGKKLLTEYPCCNTHPEAGQIFDDPEVADVPSP